MNALLLYTALLFSPGGQVEVRVVDGERVVDVSGSAIAPAAFLRQLADATHRALRGEDVLAGAELLELHLHERPLDSVLRAVALATHTSISADTHTIAVSPARERAKPDDLELEAQAAWLRIVRDFPEHEAARVARYQLGRAQERLGHEDTALAHYDAAVRTDVVSPAMELALQASSDLLARRGEWAEAQRRLSQLAVHAADEGLRASARVATARALAMQGRGTEANALLDAVELSYPSRDEREAQDRRLVRARAHLAAGNAADALRELDQRAALHRSFGSTPEDLELRARALEATGSLVEASRAWLACATLSNGRAKDDAFAAIGGRRRRRLGGAVHRALGRRRRGERIREAARGRAAGTPGSRRPARRHGRGARSALETAHAAQALGTDRSRRALRHRRRASALGRGRDAVRADRAGRARRRRRHAGARGAGGKLRAPRTVVASGACVEWR
jgi:tetratricopeptide (TPR) repeat protein